MPRFALTASSLLVLLGLSAVALAQDSRITQVTVYPGSATVQRSLQLPARAQQATFSCLPAGLDVQSLQVTAPAGVAVGELSVRQQPREFSTGCRNPSQSRIRELEDRIAALQAEAQGLEHSSGWLNRFAQPAAANSIRATADALRQTGQSVALRQHQITREQEALQAQLQPLQADQERTAGNGSQASTVQITLSAPQGGTLQLSYQVRGPGWQPGYRATLDVEAQRVRLERTALVAQSSGEDWRDVPLTLSTGQPNAAANGPLPRPWRISEAPPLPPAPVMPAPAAAPTARMSKSMERAGAVADAAPAASFDASVFEGSHATQFVLPQRITVPSSGDKVTLALGQHTLDARVAVRTTPAQDLSAYLVASFALPEGVWPAGAVTLYRDGTYVGQSRLSTSTVATTGLGFGRDERIEVRSLPAQKMESRTGLFNGRQQRHVQNAWEIRNQHRNAISLQVLDAAPVSEQQDIRVESRYTPQPTSTQWNQQPGSVLWERTVPAGATERIATEHTISWPEGMRLNERR